MPPPASSTSNPMTLKRIRRELADLQKEDLGAITLSLASDSNLFVWKGSIPGPEGSPYEGGVFGVDIKLPEDYPFSAPKVMCTTRIYHMNISEHGSICIDILKTSWSPALSLFKVMLSLSSLLTDPNPKDPLVPSIAVAYNQNRAKHDDTARHWTKLYAQPHQLNQPPPALTHPHAHAHPYAQMHTSPYGHTHPHQLSPAVMAAMQDRYAHPHGSSSSPYSHNPGHPSGSASIRAVAPHVSLSGMLASRIMGRGRGASGGPQSQSHSHASPGMTDSRSSSRSDSTVITIDSDSDSESRSNTTSPRRVRRSQAPTPSSPSSSGRSVLAKRRRGESESEVEGLVTGDGHDDHLLHNRIIVEDGDGDLAEMGRMGGEGVNGHGRTSRSVRRRTNPVVSVPEEDVIVIDD